MCLIIFAHSCLPDYPLIVAANRDEFHGRPSDAIRFWPDQPDLLAGKDLSAGGTWLGVTRTGRFAALTNFRDPTQSPGERSRGALCLDFLLSGDSAAAFVAQLAPQAANYSGFNLLLWDGVQLMHFSSRELRPRTLGPGIYGVSNGLLNEAWPKVQSGRYALAQALRYTADTDELLHLLADRTPPRDDALPETGVGLPMERLLAPRFIRSPEYGTRASSVLWQHRDNRVNLVERRFNARGEVDGQVSFEFCSRPRTVQA